MKIQAINNIQGTVIVQWSEQYATQLRIPESLLNTADTTRFIDWIKSNTPETVNIPEEYYKLIGVEYAD